MNHGDFGAHRYSALEGFNRQAVKGLKLAFAAGAPELRDMAKNTMMIFVFALQRRRAVKCGPPAPGIFAKKAP